jgi:hypothetical protein
LKSAAGDSGGAGFFGDVHRTLPRLPLLNSFRLQAALSYKPVILSAFLVEPNKFSGNFTFSRKLISATLNNPRHGIRFLTAGGAPMVSKKNARTARRHGRSYVCCFALH